MDFVDWCNHVLSKLIEVRSSAEALAHGGVFDTRLAQSLFGEEQTTQAGFRHSAKRSAVMNALDVLERFELIAKKKTGQLFKIEVKPLGREKASDMSSLWSNIMLATPQPESVQLLLLVNQCSQKIEQDHVWLDDVGHEHLLALGWSDKGKRLQAIRDLEQFGLVHSHPPLGSDVNLRATYEGLVWETRRLTDVGSEAQLVYVLFLDIVGYSKLPMGQKTNVLQQLTECVQGTDAFRRAKDGGQLISLPTGDGMALVFFRGLASHCECARELSQSLKNHPELKLRMGANTGPVKKIKDINGNVNVSGAGIDFAQRVMDCGDAGHILISNTVAEHLNELGGWGEYLHDLGETEVKHGVRVRVFNLHGSDFGNPDLPAKFISGHAQKEMIVLEGTAQPSTSQVSLEPIFEHQLTFDSDERQEYRLKFSIKNAGAGQVKSYRLEVEFPAAFLNENWHSSSEEVESRTESHRFFRMTQEIYAVTPLKQTIYGGATRHLLTIPYYVDENNHRHETLEKSIWVTVYAGDVPVQSVQRSMSEFVEL